jgi:mRNA interferase RelE/StbE
MQVLFSLEGQADFDGLPATLKARVIRVLERLAQWPDVSGAKPLKREWAGYYRIRTGDWRVIFQVISPGVIVVRIQHRSQVYED